MKRILKLLGYEFVRYESGKGRIIVDFGLTAYYPQWRSGFTIIKIGNVLVVDEFGDMFSKYPESQDHRKYVLVPIENTIK